MGRPCADCQDQTASGCQCSLTDGDTVNFTGAGSVGSPFSAEVIIDPDACNLITASAAGLLVCDTVPYCVVYRSNAQTIENDTSEELTFNTTIVDTDAMGTSGTHLDINTAGFYHCGAHSGFTPDATGSRGLTLYHGVAVIDSVFQLNNSAGHSWQASLSQPVLCAAGDTISVHSYQDSGGQLDTETGFTTLWAFRVGP